MRAFYVALVCICLGQARASDPARKVTGKDSDWLSRKLVESTDDDLRAAIIHEMGTRRDPSLLPLLVNAAGDPDRGVRKKAIVALAAYGPALADSQRDGVYAMGLQDSDPAVLDAARTALAARLQAGAEPGMDALVDQLITLCRTGQAWQTRKAAVELLERLPTRAGGDELSGALRDVASRETHPEVRRAAIIALGSRGVGEARGLLSRLRSTDPEEQVRLAAEDALRRIGGPATSIVVAVLPFETKSKSVGAFTAGPQDFFTNSLAASEVARVVERRQVNAIMKELRFQDAHIDDGRAVKVGKMLRAGQIVTGSIQVSGDEVTCLAKRIDVETGEVWAAQPVVGAIHDLAALQRLCARRLMGNF